MLLRLGCEIAFGATRIAPKKKEAPTKGVEFRAQVFSVREKAVGLEDYPVIARDFPCIFRRNAGRFRTIESSKSEGSCCLFWVAGKLVNWMKWLGSVVSFA